MSEQLNQGFIAREKRAGAQARAMKSFFDGLSGKAKRKMRLAHRKITGKPEGAAAMMKRLSAGGGAS